MDRRRNKTRLRSNDLAYVRLEDLHSFPLTPDLPFLKRIELENLKPSHFGLERWEPNFTIPDRWMRKIYKKEIYRDTDLPKPEPERLAPWQLSILNEYVRKQREESESLQPATTTSKRSRKAARENLPKDELLDQLRRFSNKQESLKQNHAKPSFETPELERISGHKIQSTEVIVQTALDKMRSLSPEEEEKFQRLLRDREYMDALMVAVGRSLKKKKKKT